MPAEGVPHDDPPPPSASFSDPSSAAATGGDPAASDSVHSPQPAEPPISPGGRPDSPPGPAGSARAGSLVCLVNASPYFRADATGGDPSSPSFEFSPHLAGALLDQEACVHSVWPAFSELRAAAHAPKQSRLRIVISAAVCEARLIFAAAFLTALGSPRHSWPHSTATGRALFTWIQALLAHGTALLPSRWSWTHQQAELLHAHLAMVVAPAPWTAAPLPPCLFSGRLSTGAPLPGRTPRR